MKLKVFLLDPGREGSWRDLGLFVARAAFGGSLVVRHGYGKIAVLSSSLFVHPVPFFDPLGLGPTPTLALATFAEVVCSLGVALGLFGRLACLPLVVNFSVIVFVMHELGVPGDRGELALLYLLAFLALLFTGSGRYSIDHWLRSRQAPTTPSPTV